MSASPVRVTDIMSGNVVTLSPTLSLRDASITLARNRLSGAPVVDENRVVGVLSASDILDFIAACSEVRPPAALTLDEVRPAMGGRAGEGGEWGSRGGEHAEVPSVADFYRLGSPEQVISAVAFDAMAAADLDLLQRHSVREIMTRSVIAVPPTAGVHEAASYLFWAGIHRVLVMDGEQLIGVVSTMDIVEAVARGGPVRG